MTELGIFAGLFLITALIIILKDLVKRIKASDNNNDRCLGLLLITLLVGICIESLVTDIMNFRQYWFLYAIVACYLINSQKNEVKDTI